jgi:hypothetical protein
MKFRHIILPALFVVVPSVAMAQGASRHAPGHQSPTTMPRVAPGPGQSEYAPGHLKGNAQSARKFTPAYKAKHPETTGTLRRR